MVADLTQLFPLAEVSAETRVIDFGTLSAEENLLQGWSGFEQNKSLSYIWSDGPASSVRIFLSYPRDTLLSIRCWPFGFQGAPQQTISIFVNGKFLESRTLTPEPNVYPIRLPARFLKKGDNLLKFQYGYSRQPLSVAPKSDDRRFLAVGWDYLRIDSALSGKPSVKKASTDPVLLLPSNSYVTYYLQIPNGSVLTAEKVVANSPHNKNVTLKILLTGQSNLRKEFTLQVSSEDPRSMEWEIPDRSEKRVSLTVMAVSDDPASLEASLELIRPVIRGPKPEAVKEKPSKTIARLQSLKRRVNIIVYLLDALRADHLGVYGYQKPTSPNMDQLAKEGILFENAFAQAPYTLASVVSIFTSKYPTFINQSGKLIGEYWTLAEVLKASGYQTLALSASPYVSKVYGTTQGFDDYQNVTVTPNLNDSASKISKELFPVLKRFSRSSDPFFMYIHSVNPHSPYRPPDPYFDAFRNPKQKPIDTSNENLADIRDGKVTAPTQFKDDIEAQYDGNILFGDSEIGNFMRMIRELGLAENTVVIITSDHGEEFFDHGGILHGGQLFDEMIRAPLIVWSPTIFSQPKRISTNVELIDLMPTIIDFALIRESYIVPEMQGRSLVSLIEGETPQNDTVHSYDPEINALAVRDSEWKYIYSPKGMGYGIGKSDTVDWLFNMKKDVRERQNKAAESVEFTGKLRGEALSWLKHEKKKKSESGEEPLQIGMDEATKEQLRTLGYVDD